MTKIAYPQIIKTEDFFVGKKHEKRMFIINKTDFEFNQVAKFIALNEFREKRAENQREERRAKRKIKSNPYFKFAVSPEEITYERVQRADIPELHQLERGEYYLSSDFSGLFRGSEDELKYFLKSLFEEPNK